MVIDKTDTKGTKSYIVVFEPETGNDPVDLESAMKNFDASVRCFGSTWIVKTDEAAKHIFETLRPTIEDGDKILVMRLEREASSTGLTNETREWLGGNL